MTPSLRCLVVLALASACASCARVEAIDLPLPPSCTQRVQSRLFFGLETPHGPVADSAWQAFIDDVVTSRFSEGLTVLEARGQWRDADGTLTKEPSRVLELVHADSAAQRQRLAEIVDAYKLRFQQQAVLLTQMPVRACV